MKCPCGSSDYSGDPRAEYRQPDGATCVRCGSQVKDGRWSQPTKEPYRSQEKASA